jgi:hypothetical protein
VALVAGSSAVVIALLAGFGIEAKGIDMAGVKTPGPAPTF